MSIVIDITGLRFGTLTVLGFSHRGKRRAYFWKCKCNCGKEVCIRGTHLRSQKSKSCGCVHGIALSVPVTHEQLLRVMKYDPKTGIFVWKISGRKYKKGDTATKNTQSMGYQTIVLQKKIYTAHVLAWFYMTGQWPVFEIDHKDTCRINNKWENLRPATRTQNCMNSRVSKNNSSGFKGVGKMNGRFRAYIRGKHLGMFDTAEEAAVAYDTAATAYAGDFARPNFEAL